MVIHRLHRAAQFASKESAENVAQALNKDKWDDLEYKVESVTNAMLTTTVEPRNEERRFLNYGWVISVWGSGNEDDFMGYL